MFFIVLLVLSTVVRYVPPILRDYYYSNKVVANRSFTYDPEADPIYRRDAFIEGQVSQGLSRDRAIRYAAHMNL